MLRKTRLKNIFDLSKLTWSTTHSSTQGQPGLEQISLFLEIYSVTQKIL